MKPTGVQIFVTCAICGHTDYVHVHSNFSKSKNAKWPDVWVCDIHQEEFCRDAMMKQLERETYAI